MSKQTTPETRDEGSRKSLARMKHGARCDFQLGSFKEIEKIDESYGDLAKKEQKRRSKGTMCQFETKFPLTAIRSITSLNDRSPKNGKRLDNLL